MYATMDKEERKEQKEFLRKLYPDYDPKRHDYFIERYNKDLDTKRLEEYHKNRGIK